MRYRIGRWPNVQFGAGSGLAAFGHLPIKADICRLPATPWRHVLVGIDSSDNSPAAFEAVKYFGIDSNATVTAIHVSDVPGIALIANSTMTRDKATVYIAREWDRAEKDPAAFVKRAGHYRTTLSSGTTIYPWEWCWPKRRTSFPPTS